MVAIKKEMNNIISLNVWTDVESFNVPIYTKPIGLKWIFNIKSNGRYKDLIVSQGCNQLSGIY